MLAEPVMSECLLCQRVHAVRNCGPSNLLALLNACRLALCISPGNIGMSRLNFSFVRLRERLQHRRVAIVEVDGETWLYREPRQPERRRWPSIFIDGRGSRADRTEPAGNSIAASSAMPVPNRAGQTPT